MICDHQYAIHEIKNLRAYPEFPVLRDVPELDDFPEEPDELPRPPPPFRFSIARGSSLCNGAAHAVSARAVSSRMEIATDLGTAVDKTMARQEIRVAAMFKSFMSTDRLRVEV